MDTTNAAVTAPASPGAGRALWGRLGRDYAYVLSGLPVSALAFALLVPLTVASVATLVVWLGALLLPLTLMLATGFAELSRLRVRLWGRDLDAVPPRSGGLSIRGAVRIVSDPRRWLDLAFETLVAFPLRLVTFVVVVTWTAAGLGGVTSILWSWSLPGGSGWNRLLQLIAPSAVPADPRGQYLLDSGVNFALGVAFLLTLPVVLHALTRLDVVLTSALLGAEGRAGQGASASARVRAPGNGDAPGAEPSREAAFRRLTWTWLAVSFPALILMIVAWPVTAALYGVHPALAMVLAVGHSAAAVLTVRWARTGLGLAALCTLGMMIATADAAGPWPWPVTTLLTHCLVIVFLALSRPWFWAAAAWAAGALLSVAGLALNAERLPGDVANAVVLLSVSGGLALLGVLVRLWALSVSRVKQAETASAEELRRRQELQERNRIARELHDVVAHSMSVIAVQATTAKYRKPGIDASVQQEFDDIAESSRQALGEMRALLGLLRGDDAAPTAPVPGLADIGDLVEATRASGTSILYSAPEAGPEAPAAVGLTAFRVVQEGLSNALRHAPGSSVEVTIAVDESGERLLVTVVNSAPEGEQDPAPGSGLGLVGIRERVAALGGTVDAVPTPQRGFAVSASLPLGGE